ncbi:MAG: Major facilitator superfamily MFS_1 [Desulfotomaculum sp. 46_296]|nr:MAG: Major facilitator superfamily MFS_1 [Desulfotomaculum sp. 46_296]
MADDVKVFGMKAEAGRWIFVILGLIINICLGAVYSWSVFRKPLEKLFSVGATESLLPFILFLALFAIIMPIIGPLLDKLGPRLFTILGGIIVGIGWIMGGKATSMSQLAIYYGVIGGIGVGIVYNCPIGVCGRWFPDKRGLAVGLTVLGFGLSPFITAPLAKSIIASAGPLAAMFQFGIAFLILIAILGLPLKFPPAGFKPEGWNPPAAAAGVKADFTTGQMLSTGSFYGVWFCYIIGTLAGLMAIGVASPVGQELFKLDATSAAMFVSIFAIFNGIGRPIFGALVDKISARNAAALSFVIIFVAAILLGKFSGSGSASLYGICFSLLWLCLGGWLAIAPAATGAFFGTKNYGPNYGLVFTAYGIGAIIGNLLAGKLRDITGSYVSVFFPYVTILAVVGFIVALLLMHPPRKA